QIALAAFWRAKTPDQPAQDPPTPIALPELTMPEVTMPEETADEPAPIDVVLGPPCCVARRGGRQLAGSLGAASERRCDGRTQANQVPNQQRRRSDRTETCRPA